MPWSYPDNVPASMKYMKPSIQKKAIAIANHVLQSTGNDGEAIATGIKKAKVHHDKMFKVASVIAKLKNNAAPITGATLGFGLGALKKEDNEGNKFSKSTRVAKVLIGATTLGLGGLAFKNRNKIKEAYEESVKQMQDAMDPTSIRSKGLKPVTLPPEKPGYAHYPYARKWRKRSGNWKSKHIEFKTNPKTGIPKIASLIKLAANRMTKELMHGRLSQPGINQIIDFDNQQKPTSKLNQKISQKGNVPIRRMLRRDDQIVSGLHKGTEEIVRKNNEEVAKAIATKTPTNKYHIHSYDLGDYGHVTGRAKDLINDAVKEIPKDKKLWLGSHNVGRTTITGFGGKVEEIEPYIAYDKKGKSLSAALAGRHELFEAQAGQRHDKRLHVKGGRFFSQPDYKITHNDGNLNGRILTRHGMQLGQHNDLGVLGRESTEMSRLFKKDKTDIYKMRFGDSSWDTRGKWNEARLLKGITGKDYGTKYGKKQMKILSKIKPLKEHPEYVGFEDAIRQGEKLRNVKKPNNVLKYGVPLALLGGAAYGLHKYLKKKGAKKRPSRRAA